MIIFVSNDDSVSLSPKIKILLFTKYSIPETNESSSMTPSAHQPALFLIQDGIVVANEFF